MSARKGPSGKSRKLNPATGAEFLREEHLRERLGNGRMVMPQPRFSQVDNGVHTGENRQPLGVHFDPTSARMKSWNDETDHNGGLF